MENIFRGYVRMKLNKFNDVIKEQLRVSSIASQYMDEEPDWIEGKIIQDPSLIGY